MLPQSAVMILAPIRPEREVELRQFLEALTLVPGLADPESPLMPFGVFDRLHMARFLILEDPTPDDIAVYGMPAASFPPALAFFADCDGSEDEFLAQFAQ